MKKILFHITHLKKVSFACILLSSLYSASALTISPARFELTADPGKATTNEFTIVNEQNSDQIYYTSVENFEAQGESGTPNFTTDKVGFASWVQVVDKVAIKKGEKITIPFTTNIPQNADAGGHFAAICLTTTPPAVGGGEVSVGAKICMIMLLKVSGEIKEDGGVSSFFLKSGNRFVTILPINFVYRFNNNGNDRVKPAGTTTIRNMIGLTTEEINANPTEGNVLPGSIRRFEITWGSGEPLPASASFFSHVQYETRNFALGLYFANLDLVFGTKKASNSLWFVVIPWHLLVVIFFIGAIVFLVLRFMLQRYNKYIIAQARMMNAESNDKESNVVNNGSNSLNVDNSKNQTHKKNHIRSATHKKKKVNS